MVICEFFDGSNKNVASKWFFDLYSKSLDKSIIHPCPFSGELKSYNITADSNLLKSTFFTGQYRSSLRFFDEFDDNIFTLLMSMDLINFSTLLND